MLKEMIDVHDKYKTDLDLRVKSLKKKLKYKIENFNPKPITNIEILKALDYDISTFIPGHLIVDEVTRFSIKFTSNISGVTSNSIGPNFINKNDWLYKRSRMTIFSLKVSKTDKMRLDYRTLNSDLHLACSSKEKEIYDDLESVLFKLKDHEQIKKAVEIKDIKDILSLCDSFTSYSKPLLEVVTSIDNRLKIYES